VIGVPSALFTVAVYDDVSALPAGVSTVSNDTSVAPIADS